MTFQINELNRPFSVTTFQRKGPRIAKVRQEIGMIDFVIQKQIEKLDRIKIFATLCGPLPLGVECFSV